MPDLVLSALQWQRWPKDPSWSYVDVSDSVRVALNARTGHYALRILNGEGDCQARYTNLGPHEVVEQLAKLLPGTTVLL